MVSSTRARTADIRVRDVAVSENDVSVAPMDGHSMTVPLAWYPRLANAAAQRLDRELAGAGDGIHWPQIDEDLSTEGLLLGDPAPAGSAAWRSPVIEDP